MEVSILEIGRMEKNMEMEYINFPMETSIMEDFLMDSRVGKVSSVGVLGRCFMEIGIMGRWEVREEY